MISDLSDVPAIREFLRRVGAEPRSLSRATISEFDGQYRKEVATIRFAADGTISVRDQAYAPTPAEQAAIASAWASVDWPQYIPAPSLDINPPSEWQGQRENLFVVRAQHRLPGQDKRTDYPALMVHQRIPKENGAKDYWCWTFYDDNQWRLAEPPDALPLYGLENLGSKTIAYLHEGANAARECARHAETGAHPWPELGAEDTVHLAWLGGARAVGKTDFSPLGQAGLQRIVIVADNDESGKEVIPQISRSLACYDIAVSGIQFTDDFPRAHDLGDVLTPEASPELFSADHNGKQVYVGPQLRELERPATWATAPLPMPGPTGRGRPPKQAYRLRKAFLREWWMAKTDKGALLINRHDRTRLVTEQSFSTETRGRADCPVFDMFKAKAFPRTVDGIAYEPGREIEITVDGCRQVNTWVPSRIRAARNPHPDSWAFWEEFLKHLFPVEEERLQVMRWVATLIARPKVRMLYALLLFSKTQGVGKTTLCEILRVLVGEHNSGCPSAHDVVNSNFNSWLVRKRFIYVNEIYESGNLKAYDQLKTYITDGHIVANEKMIPQYVVANKTHYIFCSNSEAPLSVDGKDRRIFVPTVAEEKQSREWWREFYANLNARGYEAIAAWAEQFVRHHGAVQAGADAPATARKSQLIEDSRSRMESLVHGLADVAQDYEHTDRSNVKTGLVGAVIVTSDLENWLAFKFPKNKLPPQANLRRWLVDGGMVQASKRLKVDGQMQWVFLPRRLADGGWTALKDYRAMPHDVFEAAEAV